MDKDNEGQGMSEEEVGLLGTHFYLLKCKGQLVKSSRGKGTTVTITFPGYR